MLTKKDLLIEYQMRYKEYLASLRVNRVISLAANEALVNFPQNLPRNPARAIRVGLQEALEKLESVTSSDWQKVPENELKEGQQEAYVLNIPAPTLESESAKHPIVGATWQLFSIILSADKKISDFDFDRPVNAQHLVMVVAYIDAFLADSLRYICMVEPRKLRRNKNMTWNTIVEAGDWDSIIERIIDEYCFEFGVKSLKERVKELKESHGLELTIPEDILDELDYIERIRHVVIHNGGKVSQEFMARTKRNDYKIGYLIPITEELLSKLNWIAENFGTDVFSAIEKKYFQDSRSEGL